MKKRTPIFLVIILIAFPIKVAYGSDEWRGVLSLFYSFDFSRQIDNDSDISLGVLFGIGLSFQFPVNYELTVEPMVSAEYSFSIYDSELLRIRTGVRFDKLYPVFFLTFLGGYAGLSGAFIADFTNDAVAFGISPEIGLEWYMFFLGMRVQVQYDFYTTERYNRFVLTTSLCIIFPKTYIDL